MDKLVKRAGVAMLVMLATAGSAFAWGLARHAGVLGSRRSPPTLKLEAALKSPKAPLFASIATPQPQAEPVTVIDLDLPDAFGKALGTTPKKAAPRLKGPGVVPDTPRRSAATEADEARPDDLLDFGPGGSEREAKLSERGAKAFSVRQPGGAEAEHKLIKDSAERVTFETDLAKPGDH